MERAGTEEQPLRVAVIGSGPAGFYAVQALQKTPGLVARVDMFDRLPTPFGLVRHGVAPDHPKIKKVVAVYDKLASSPHFRFFGNVEYGRDLRLEDLREHYHQVVFATGAQTDRRLGIPGEDLTRSHPATEFVAWYNGHPDFVDCRFDLSRPRAAVIGVGNVAVDVARILCRTPEELAATDIAEHALDALRQSRIREVFLLGRRGPAQAAFTNPEVKELGEMADADACTVSSELELDPASRKAVEADSATARKVEILQAMADRAGTGKSRRMTLRFLVSPVELLEDGAGGVAGLKLAHNRLVEDDRGRVRAEPTGTFETLPVDLVFRSVGYRGVALPGIPFREDWGIVPNDAGRVLDGTDGAIRTGLYVTGWIKRGPSGVIGTNKPDAVETVEKMLADAAAGRCFRPTRPLEAVDALLAAREVPFLSYDDWRRIDAYELRLGEDRGRPRHKLVRPDEFRQALEEPE